MTIVEEDTMGTKSRAHIIYGNGKCIEMNMLLFIEHVDGSLVDLYYI